MTNQKTAFVFPGGGSQKRGVLDEFRDEWPEIDRQLDRIDHDGLESLLFDADNETLGGIVNMHRAVVASGLVVAEAVRSRFDIDPDFVAGHSLGHITALPVAEMLSPSDAVEFAVKRGKAMEHGEETAGPGKMVAVLLVEASTIESVTANIDGVRTAVYNTPKQTVISGKTDAVDEACSQLEDVSGAIKLVELDVATASHSPVMEPAVDHIERALANVRLTDPAVPVVSDVTGEPYETNAKAKRDLQVQIESPIHWISVVETLARCGVERVIEFPPAGSLSAFIPEIAPEMDVIALEEPADATKEFTDDRLTV